MAVKKIEKKARKSHGKKSLVIPKTIADIILPSGEAIRFKNLIAVNDVYLALANPLRFKILRLLNNADKKELNVAAIQIKTKIGQSVISQHLGILRFCNLVYSKQRGREMFYAIRYKELKKVLKSARVFMPSS